MADGLKLARDLGHPLEDLNVGGGLGIRYVASDDPPSIEQWVKVVADAVTAACRDRQLELPRLLCEPGRSLVATAGVTLYTVGSRKTIPGIRTYVAIDGLCEAEAPPATGSAVGAAVAMLRAKLSGLDMSPTAMACGAAGVLVGLALARVRA